MEILLLTLSVLCLIVGLAGAVLPLPGPPLSFAGMMLLEWSGFAQFNTGILWSFGLLTVAIVILDYYIPIWGTKKFGGTRFGAIGAVAGMLIGLIFIPGIGIFLGTFLGAMIGELLGGAQTRLAINSAFGSFVGFISGIVMKVILCLAMIVFSAIEVFQYWS